MRWSWQRQVLVFGTAYAAYELARWLTTGDPATAIANAHQILGLESRLGVDLEAGIQRGLLTLPMAVLFMNFTYLAAQLLVVPFALAWLYRRRHGAYLVLRNALIATWLISVPVYALFPVAPPRLADIGMIDTVTDHAGIALDSNFSTIFYNPFAAVPSLHAGFAFAIGLTVAAVARTPTLRIAGLLWGPLVSLAVVSTGNHFVLDIVAGLAVTAAGFALALATVVRGGREREVRISTEPVSA